MANYIKSKSEIKRRGRRFVQNSSKVMRYRGSEINSIKKQANASYNDKPFKGDISKEFDEDFIKAFEDVTKRYNNTLRNLVNR